MSTKRPIVYKPMSQRVTTMIWGLLVIAFGGGVIAHLSGYSFDVELLGIIALAVLGVWILASAVVGSLRR